LPHAKWLSEILRPKDHLVFSLAFPDRTISGISIHLTDSAGRTAILPPGEVFNSVYPLQYHLTKFIFLETTAPVLVLQTVDVPLARFLAHNRSLRLTQLRSVELQFTEGPGAILLDDIGFARCVQKRLSEGHGNNGSSSNSHQIKPMRAYNIQ
jgi:hypothetical protein